MTSIILTLISIVLVGALALATLFFGGEAIHGGNARAVASTVLNQGEQIVAAARLYYIERGAVAPNLAALVAEGYLTSVPIPPKGLQVASWSISPISSAYADDAFWVWDAATETLALVRQVTSTEVCGLVNETNMQTTEIKDAIDTDVRAQCYGSDKPYTVIWNGKVSVSLTGTAELDTGTGTNLCDGAINLGHNPATCASGTGGAVKPAGGGASSASGLAVTTYDPLTFLGATYWVTNEIRTVTLTNTSGADQWLDYRGAPPQADMSWGPRVDVLDTTCPDRFPAGGTCVVRLIRAPYSNINRSALAESVVYQPTYMNDMWEPIGTPARLTFQVGEAFDNVSEIQIPAMEGSVRRWVTYSTFLRNTVQGLNEGASISQQYTIYIYPTVGGSAWDFTVPVGECHYAGVDGEADAADFNENAANLTCSVDPGTPPGLYQGWRRRGADQYVLCASPDNPMGMSCSGTEYGYYKVRVL